VNAAHAGQGGCLDPCYDPRDKEALLQLQACPSGRTLQRAAIVECYCVAQLGRVAAAAAASAASVASASASSPATSLEQMTALSYEQVSAGGVLELCQAPAYQYFVSQVISAVSSAVVNVMNELIRFALPVLVDWEKRGSLSEVVTAFYAKSLIFLFMNTVGLLLLIHLRVENPLLNHFGACCFCSVLSPGSSRDGSIIPCLSFCPSVLHPTHQHQQ
jgi:hypothetical protein